MKTYQIDFFEHGIWNPGLIVRMKPNHLPFYLQYLNGERPIFTDGRRITREKHRCLPTRVRHVEPNWKQEDGFYVFDGISLEHVNLTARRRR